MNVGIVLEPKDKTDGIRAIAAAPIETSVAPQAVLSTSKSSHYSPEVRILDELVGASGNAFPPFTSTATVLTTKMSQLLKGAKDYKEQLSSFYEAYSQQGLYNSSWHEHIQRALFQYLSNADIDAAEKRDKLRKLQSYKGFWLYMEILSTTFTPQTKSTPQQQMQNRAFNLIGNLDKMTQSFKVEGKTIDKDLLNHQTLYLRLLLGYAFAKLNTGEHDFALNILKSLSKDLYSNITENKMNVWEQIRLFYLAKLKELTGEEIEMGDELMKATPVALHEVFDYGKVKYQKIQNGTYKPSHIQSIRARGPVKIDISRNTNRAENRLYVLKPGANPTLVTSGEVINDGDALFFWPNMDTEIQGITISGRLELQKSFEETDPPTNDKLIDTNSKVNIYDRLYRLGDNTHLFSSAKLDLDKDIQVKFLYGERKDFKDKDWLLQARENNYLVIFAEDYNQDIVQSVSAQLSLLNPRKQTIFSHQYVGASAPRALASSVVQCSKATGSDSY
jgi:hypothetical protein